MLWQCENKCRPPREVKDGQCVICGHCKLKHEPPELRKAPKVGNILKGFKRMQMAAIAIQAMGAGCNCETVANKMNQLGPDGCEQHFDELIDDMRNSAKEAGIPFFEKQARGMLTKAIRLARKATASSA